MAIPPNAFQLTRAYDPTDKADWALGVGGMLQEGEEMVDPVLTRSAEAIALDVNVLDSGGYEPVITADEFVFWTEVSEASRGDPAFGGAGTAIPFELTFDTNSEPARRFQRTVYITVGQQ